LNQETTAWSSEAFHDNGSVLFSLKQALHLKI